MEALVIDRKTLPELILSIIGAEWVRVSKTGASVLLTPAVNERADAELADRRARRRAAFDEIPIDMTGFKFNRDEANDYE